MHRTVKWDEAKDKLLGLGQPPDAITYVLEAIMNKEELDRICDSFRIPSEVYKQVSHYQALNPIVLGYLVGSTPDMANSLYAATLVAQLLTSGFGLF